MIVLVSEMRGHLQHFVNGFEEACDTMGLKINVGESKILMIKKDQRRSCEKLRVSEEELQDVEEFNYLAIMITTDGGTGEEVANTS